MPHWHLWDPLVVENQQPLECWKGGTIAMVDQLVLVAIM